MNFDAHLFRHDARGRVIREKERAASACEELQTGRFTRIEGKGPAESG